MAQTGARVDPYRNFNFLVEIDGIAQASFIECSGLETTTEVIETREGGNNTTMVKLPGKTSYSDITLKWGLTASQEIDLQQVNAAEQEALPLSLVQVPARRIRPLVGRRQHLDARHEALLR